MIEDITEGKKGAMALIINQALKEYFKKNKMEITPPKAKGEKIMKKIPPLVEFQIKNIQEGVFLCPGIINELK